MYNSLKFFRDNDLTEHPFIEQHFVTAGCHGTDHELIHHGAQILVTNENKEQFIRLKCDYLAGGVAASQLALIKRGFNEAIDPNWVSHFTVHELEA